MTEPIQPRKVKAWPPFWSSFRTVLGWIVAVAFMISLLMGLDLFPASRSNPTVAFFVAPILAAVSWVLIATGPRLRPKLICNGCRSDTTSEAQECPVCHQPFA